MHSLSLSLLDVFVCFVVLSFFNSLYVFQTHRKKKEEFLVALSLSGFWVGFCLFKSLDSVHLKFSFFFSFSFLCARARADFGVWMHSVLFF